MKILFETPIDRPFLEVRDGFNQKLFEALKPPGVALEVERFDGCKKGDEFALNISMLGKTQSWQGLVTQDETTSEHWFFVDEGKVLPWPLTKWKHIHKVVKVTENTSKIIDDISFECATPWLLPFVAPGLWLSFAIRPYKYQQYFKN